MKQKTKTPPTLPSKKKSLFVILHKDVPREKSQVLGDSVSAYWCQSMQSSWQVVEVGHSAVGFCFDVSQ